MHFSPRPNRAAEIGWRPWGREAFDEAKLKGKPVLLGISAVWCHWCHVMDETTYSDDAVIKLIKERYIPIRVDNDRRPDVNARYNMGGWPSTIFLTPEGEIMHGGTYLPPEVMRALLKQIGDFYDDPTNRLDIAKRVNELRVVRDARSPTADAVELDPQTSQAVIATLDRAFDEEYGGFGDEPKFPQTGGLRFLLDYFARTRDPRAQTMVEKTLRGMAGGGMYDHVEGGFFRYSTTRDWSIPHFEKMLEDQAGLLSACTRASAMFGDADLAAVAVDVVRYLDASLWVTPQGAYGGSQDADEDYYSRDAAGRRELHAPFIDTVIYTSWNAELAEALIVGGPLLGHAGSGWPGRGLAVLETLWSRLLVDGLMARWFDGSPNVRGLLADQVWSARAALAAHSYTGDEQWLARALALARASEALYDAEAGAYLDRLADPGEPGRVSHRIAPLEENALMARVLLALGARTGEAEWAARARSILVRYASTYRTLGTFAAGFASAALDVVEPPVDIHLVGSGDAAARLRSRALGLASPALRVDPIAAELGGQRARALALDAPSSTDGAPTAYLCRGTTCFARVRTAEELTSALSVTAQPAGSSG